MGRPCRDKLTRSQLYEDHGSRQVVQAGQADRELAMMVLINIKMLMEHSRILEEATAAVTGRFYMAGHLPVRELQGS